MQRPAVSVSQGAGGPSRQLCAPSTLWGGPELGGVVGGWLGTPSGAPVRAERPDVTSVLPHHSFHVAVFIDLKNRHHETKTNVERFWDFFLEIVQVCVRLREKVHFLSEVAP